ncbi:MULTISPECIES: ABC transporter permease [unclassified Mycobacterium]|uniref:ABC transporter permease n=1 Tax=Mycobacterium sp. DL99 TaxID=2528957 RepID=UPI0010802EFE|nr:ABC transporter permease [Mycobacterium sp. DL99]
MTEVAVRPGRWLIPRRAIRTGTHAGWSERFWVGALIALTLVALTAPLLAPHSALIPAGTPLTPPDSAFLFGTDDAGRDLLSRCLLGLRTSWFAALAVIASGLVIGGGIGLVAGAVGGWVDTLLMRLTDLFLALPAPVLAIAVVSALGPSLTHTLIGVAVVWWPYYSRIVRGEIRQLAARPHVEAARVAGVGVLRLWGRHLLPGAIPTILVAASLDVGGLIVTLAGLSFIGLGAPQPAPELGSMAAAGIPMLLNAAWISVAPAMTVLLAAFIANKAGDALRIMLGNR